MTQLQREKTNKIFSHTEVYDKSLDSGKSVFCISKDINDKEYVVLFIGNYYSDLFLCDFIAIAIFFLGLNRCSQIFLLRLNLYVF